MTHPSMPTVEPSAQASAAAMHCKREGIASGRCGLCEMVCANRLSFIEFYRVTLLLPLEAQTHKHHFPGMLRRRSQTSQMPPAGCKPPPRLWESGEPSQLYGEGDLAEG